MGYYTTFYLEEYNPETGEFTDASEYGDELDQSNVGISPLDESCKWYNYSDDMEVFSKKYPDTVFVLSGIGECPDDRWREYWKNGKHQHTVAKVSYDDYNPNELS